jgi:hypothetical protein
VLVGLGFFPYVLLTLGGAGWLRRWGQPKLVMRAEQLALGLGALLTLVSLLNPLVRSLNLLLSALTLGWVCWRRSSPSPRLIHLAHGVGLAALLSWLNWRFPDWTASGWATLLIGAAVLEWGGVYLSLVLRGTADFALGRSAWFYGLALAGGGYMALWLALFAPDKAWGWLALAVPISLTALGGRRDFWAAPWASGLSAVALLVMQPMLFQTPLERGVGLGVATLLMLWNTRQLCHIAAACLTIGFGLAWVGVLLSDLVGQWLSFEWALVLVGVAVMGLWQFRGWLASRANQLAHVYRWAADGWAWALTIVLMLIVTVANLVFYIPFTAPDWRYGGVAALLLLATGDRTRQHGQSAAGWWAWMPANLGLLAAGWNLELLIATVIVCLTISGGQSAIEEASQALDRLGIANLVLGFVTQQVGDRWRNRRLSRSSNASPPSPTQPWTMHLVPLLYATIGALLLNRNLTALTGLYTLVAALIGIGVGRRMTALSPLTALSVGVLSVGAFELLIYQLFQAEGGAPGDGLTLLAALGLGFAVVYQLGQRWLMPWLRFSAKAIQVTAHLHWLLANLLAIAAISAFLSDLGAWLWSLLVAGLGVYGLVMGNRYWRSEDQLEPQSLWTGVGLVQLLVAVGHGLTLVLPDSLLIDWAGAIAVAIAALLYRFPWQRWGWNQPAGRGVAAVLPGLTILLTATGTNVQSLLIVAAFYGWLASAERRTRLSYIGMFLTSWAVFRWLDQLGSREPLWYGFVLGGMLLYIAQVEPALAGQSQRENRHWLRSGATGLICLTAFYQAQLGIAGLPPIGASLLAIAVHLGFVAAGLIVRVRAFLYVGTLAFILQVLWQSWRFVSDYPTLLWALGIALGLVFIWVAATFEARRSQMSTLLSQWMAELEIWQ